MKLDFNRTLDFQHTSVMLEECIQGLRIQPEGIYVDGTAGGAGHSVAIAKALTTGTLLAIDKDRSALETAKARLAPYASARVVQGDFRELGLLLDQEGIDKVDGILLDLGVSSHQLDTPERGFSYRFDAPLDMRMNPSASVSAYDVVNTYSHGELARVFQRYGEERFAGQIASRIIDARQQKPVETTFELVELIKAGIPAATRRTGGHPAKRVFQAIRIEVNGELDALEEALQAGFFRLRQGGRFVILTFHSLEDRIVKHAFREFSTGCTCPPDFPICVCGKQPKGKLITRKPITASPEELAVNSRSESAKLRIIERI